MLPDARGKKGRASHVSPIDIYRIHEEDFLIGVGKGGIFFVLEKVKLVFLEGKGGIVVFVLCVWSCLVGWRSGRTSPPGRMNCCS